MRKLNNLLQEQIDKYLEGTAIPENFIPFLRVVSETYEQLAVAAARETIAQQQTHLEVSQRIAHIGSWELDIENMADINSNSLAWSDETYRILGLEPGTVVPTTELFLSKVHPDDTGLLHDAINMAVINGLPYDIEHRIILSDGQEKIVQARSSTLFDTITNTPIKLRGTLQDITQRKKADEELQKANRELRTLFKNMQEVFFSVDMENHQLLQISPACEQVYGYPQQDFIDNPTLWFEMILEEDRQGILDNDSVLSTGRSVINTFRSRDKNGHIKWLESKITPTLNKEGKLIRVDGTTSDITKRKQIEIALINSEYKFRSLIENNSDAIMIVDQYAVASYASNSLERVTGYTPEEVVGRSVLNFIHPEDLSIAHSNLDNVVVNPGKTVSVNYRRLKKGGTYIWCEGTITNLLNEPAVNGIIVNFRDITERKNAEAALRDSEYRFRSIIQNASDVILIVNEKSEIIFASDSLRRITGYHPKDVIGVPSVTFVHPEDIFKIQRSRVDLLNNPGKTNTLQYRRRKKDGTYIWCESVATNMMSDPIVRGIIVNFRDITDQKKYIEALTTSNEDLKKTNMELDRFVYSVSHDLRAPLSSMLGVLQLVQSDVTDPLILNDLLLIEGSIKKLDGFILDILDYSRNSRLETKLEIISFNNITNEVMSHLKYMGAGNTYIDIRVKITENEHFYSDKGRISMILNNLISNAIRYSNPDSDHPFVEINITSSEKEAFIRIKDNGIGISEKNQQKVFDIFYRISSNSIGSGLGLYIVKESVAKLQGYVLLESVPGEGSEFIIHLPNLIKISNKQYV
jgi:PAS domain S-box-containing protein